MLASTQRGKGGEKKTEREREKGSKMRIPVANPLSPRAFDLPDKPGKKATFVPLCNRRTASK